MSVKEELNRYKGEAAMERVENRRLQAELLKLKSSLLKSGELLHNKERYERCENVKV